MSKGNGFDLQFTIDDQDALKKQARKQAIEEAKDQAKEMASQLGVRLVKITSFSESSGAPRYYGFEVAESDAGKGGGEAPQIETGENKIEAVIGGIHLIGAKDSKIESTVASMKKIKPSMIVPTHCTGWKAQRHMENVLKQSFARSSVGNMYVFQS